MSSKQRFISLDDLRWSGYQAVPDEAKPTAQGLWLLLDPLGRGPLDEDWIARELYPHRTRGEAIAVVEEHLLLLLDAGFLTTYVADSREWLLLLRPLKVDMRGVRITTPDPDSPPSTSLHGDPWTSVAVEREGEKEHTRKRERARERARARVREEEQEDANTWERWREEQRSAAPRRPERPLLLKAPPIGCPDHPNGTMQPCGPCGTAMEQHKLFLARERHVEKLAFFEEQQEEEPWDPDEPF